MACLQPSGNDCVKIGMAILDEFRFECFLFADIDGGLSYQMGFKPTDAQGDITWLASSSNPFMRMWFPAGGITVYARVSDRYGAVSAVYTDQVMVLSDTSRRLSAGVFWDTAIAQVQQALLLGNSGDVNKLVSVISMEVNGRSSAGTLDVPVATYITNSMVEYVIEAANVQAFKSGDYVCEVAAALKLALASPAYLHNDTLSKLGFLMKDLLLINTIKIMSLDCFNDVSDVLSSSIAAQFRLGQQGLFNAISTVILMNHVDDAMFRSIVLLTRGLVPGETQTVYANSQTVYANRQYVDSLSQSTLSFGKPSTATVFLPDEFAQAVKLYATEVVDIFVVVNQNVPSLPGFHPLSASVSTSFSVYGSKLAVSGAFATMTLDLPLNKAPSQPSSEGAILAYVCTPIDAPW